MHVFKVLFILLILSIALRGLSIVKAALDAANKTCSGIGRNQACYGNIQLKVTPREGAPLAFDKAGDIANISNRRRNLHKPQYKWGVENHIYLSDRLSRNSYRLA